MYLPLKWSSISMAGLSLIPSESIQEKEFRVRAIGEIDSAGLMATGTRVYNLRAGAPWGTICPVGSGRALARLRKVSRVFDLPRDRSGRRGTVGSPDILDAGDRLAWIVNRTVLRRVGTCANYCRGAIVFPLEPLIRCNW